MRGVAFSAAIPPQMWVAGVAIAPVTVPAALGRGPISYAVSGLPAGVTFDAATRQITGGPESAGAGQAVITATDAAGYAAALGFAWSATEEANDDGMG